MPRRPTSSSTGTTPLAPNRTRHLEDVEALVETMEAESRHRRGALGAAGQDSGFAGRTGPAQHTRWAPHLVLLAAEPSAEDAVKVPELAADASRLGIGCLVGRSGARGLPPHTEALLDELLPIWRDTIAAAG